LKWIFGLFWLGTVQVQATDILYGGGASNAVV